MDTNYADHHETYLVLLVRVEHPGSLLRQFPYSLHPNEEIRNKVQELPDKSKDLAFRRGMELDRPKGSFGQHALSGTYRGNDDGLHGIGHEPRTA